ncbi:MAG: response regulator transcription factor, partial [Gemmatimonadota bacterium]
MANILVVEDEPQVAVVLRRMLERARHDARIAETVLATRSLVEARHPDLMLLDIQLTDGSGLDLLKELRAEGHTYPVLVHTGFPMSEHEATAFESGANHFVAKDITPEALMARIEALLKEHPPISIIDPRLEIDEGRLLVRAAGGAAHLRPVQMRLLKALLEAAPKVCSHEELLRIVWQFDPPIQGPRIRVAVHELRARLAAIGLRDVIETYP